jgi:hypothetical protein
LLRIPRAPIYGYEAIGKRSLCTVLYIFLNQFRLTFEKTKVKIEGDTPTEIKSAIDFLYKKLIKVRKKSSLFPIIGKQSIALLIFDYYY